MAPIWRRISTGSNSRMSIPSIRMRPSIGSYRRQMSLNRVVLPAPLRPTTASVSPAATVNERSARAALSAPGYANVTCSTVISSRSGWGIGSGVPAPVRPLAVVDRPADRAVAADEVLADAGALAPCAEAAGGTSASQVCHAARPARAPAREVVAAPAATPAGDAAGDRREDHHDGQ